MAMKRLIDDPLTNSSMTSWRLHRGSLTDQQLRRDMSVTWHLNSCDSVSYTRSRDRVDSDRGRLAANMLGNSRAHKQNIIIQPLQLQQGASSCDDALEWLIIESCLEGAVDLSQQRGAKEGERQTSVSVDAVESCLPQLLSASACISSSRTRC